MPRPLHIPPPEIRRNSDSITVSFNLDLDSGPAPIFFRITSPDVDPQKSGEALISTALYFAMAEGRDLHSGLPASAPFLTNILQLQSIFHRWFPGFQEISIQAPERQLPGVRPTPPWEPATRGAAVLFSGGVDSFHSSLEFAGDIETAIYIHGFDTKLDHTTYRASISRHLQSAASALGMRLIEVETNLRDFSDPACFWGYYHGAMIAAVCHLLSSDFERVYVPSSYSYDQLHPWGSHPLLDPLWGSGDLEFIHHGAGSTRAEKIAAIADSAVARDHLRVCWENVDEAYNCGGCEKCIRTMINLSIFGKLDAFRHLFAKPLHIPDLLPLVCTDHPAQLRFLNNNLRDAKKFGAPAQLISEIEGVLTAASAYFMTKRVAHQSRRDTGDYFKSTSWRDHLLPKVRNQLFDVQCTADPAWLAERLTAERGRDEMFDLLWQHDRKWLTRFSKSDHA